MQKIFLLYLVSRCIVGSYQQNCGDTNYDASKYDSVVWRWRATGYVGTPMTMTHASYIVTPGNPQTHDVVEVPWNMIDSSASTSYYIYPNANLDVQIQVLTLSDKSSSMQRTDQITPTPIEVTRTDKSTDGYELFAVKWPVLNYYGGRETNKMIITVFERLPSGNQMGCSSSTLMQNDEVMICEFYFVVWSKILPTSSLVTPTGQTTTTSDGAA